MSRALTIQSLFEEIYGKLAIVYHRTNEAGMQALIKGQPFRIGGGVGAMYGPGVYATYDLKSQLNDRMSRLYGNYVVKSKVNLEKFLIFDRDVARRVYPNSPTIEEQLVRVFRERRPLKQFISSTEDFDPIFNHDFDFDSYFTSDIAHAFVRKSVSWLVRNTRGIVFTGRHDGRVVVAYDHRAMLPIAIAESTPGNHSPQHLEFKRVEQFAREAMNPPMITGITPLKMN